LNIVIDGGRVGGTAGAGGAGGAGGVGGDGTGVMKDGTTELPPGTTGSSGGEPSEPNIVKVGGAPGMRRQSQSNISLSLA